MLAVGGATAVAHVLEMHTSCVDVFSLSSYLKRKLSHWQLVRATAVAYQM